MSLMGMAVERISKLEHVTMRAFKTEKQKDRKIYKNCEITTKDVTYA